MSLAKDAEERALQKGLLEHIHQFLIELGAGFAFLGQQYRLEVGGEDFFIDLLFYHVKLRCYVVIDLKMTPFRPEYAGKMNFYLSAVDDLLRHPDDRPSIGIILCKAKNRVVAEYALRDLAKPVGVSTYITKLVESLPPALRGSLPSPEGAGSRAEEGRRRRLNHRARRVAEACHRVPRETTMMMRPTSRRRDDMARNIKRIAAGLGAEIVGQVSHTGGALGAAKVAHDVAALTARRGANRMAAAILAASSAPSRRIGRRTSPARCCNSASRTRIWIASAACWPGIMRIP